MTSGAAAGVARRGEGEDGDGILGGQDSAASKSLPAKTLTQINEAQSLVPKLQHLYHRPELLEVVIESHLEILFQAFTVATSISSGSSARTEERNGASEGGAVPVCTHA